MKLVVVLLALTVTAHAATPGLQMSSLPDEFDRDAAATLDKLKTEGFTDSVKAVKTLIEGKHGSCFSGKGTTDGEAWWRGMFSVSFDGHGNFVTPHLGTLHTTAASLGAVGYRGVWDADLSRDMPWMRRQEQAFWRTRSASALIGTDRGPTEIYAAIPGDLAEALDLKSITTQRGDGQWLVRSEVDMLYDAQFERYQAAKGRRAMEVLAPDMIHYDDWDLRSLEWPVFKTFTAFVRPLGYYPQARLGIGPRMAAKIGVTGHAIVDPYVEPQYSGWDGAGFTRRHYETLHKVIYFDLIANRGIPAFSLTFDGGYSPGSIHSAGNLHVFLNEVAPVISQREYLADIGLASSSWSQIAAQPPWAWNHAVTKRHASEFLGWSQYLASARDFPQWDVVPFDDVTLKDLIRFKLVILPSVLVITAEHLAVLEDYLKQGGKLLVTGDTGAFNGPDNLLMPREENPMPPLAKRYPGQVTIVNTKPGLEYHEDPAKTAQPRALLRKVSDHLPVLTADNPPEHIGIYANTSNANPAELTLDLVNYHYDLAMDRITPVTSSGFTVTLRVPDLKADDKLAVESFRYDETAGGNVQRQPLDAGHILANKDSVTLRIPPFTHYQVLRIEKAKP